MDILHRDLKSANIFINNNGDAKLGDLNVSKLAKMGLVFKFNNFSKILGLYINRDTILC